MIGKRLCSRNFNQVGTNFKTTKLPIYFSSINCWYIYSRNLVISVIEIPQKKFAFMVSDCNNNYHDVLRNIHKCMALKFSKLPECNFNIFPILKLCLF